MANIILKTTLLRANPGVVRQFMIDDERSIEDLLKTVAIIHGWKTGVTMQLSRGTVFIGGKSRIRDKIRTDQEYVVRTAMAGGSGRYNQPTGDNNPFWEFYLEMVPSEGETEAALEPALLRSYGIHLVTKARNMREFNDVHKKLKRGSVYYSYYLDQIVPADYAVDVTQVNNRLRRIVSQGLGGVYVNHGFGRSLQDIFGNHKVADLKMLIRFMNIPISENMRKDDLVSGLIRYFDRTVFWKMLLEEMSLNEYLQWKELVTKRELLDPFREYRFPTLMQSMMCNSIYGANITFPEPFLNYYEDFMTCTGDVELILRKKAADVLNFCIELYGVFPKKVFSKLCSVMYPDEERLPDFWQKWNEGSIWGAEKWEKLGRDVIYDAYTMDKTKAVSIKDSERFQKGIFFLPNRDQIRQIEEYGLDFSEKDRNVLKKQVESILGEYIYDYQLEVICSLIYSYYHNEIRDSFANYISDVLNLYIPRSIINKLEKESRKLADDVRLISLGGFTRKEMRYIQKQNR